MKNEMNANKNTSTLVPQSIATGERKIKENLKKDICTIFSNGGFSIQDKDVTFSPLLSYLPNFHLKYCVFLNNLPGYT